MNKEERLRWVENYVQSICSDLSLPLPKVVERESRLAGMQLDVHLTDSEIRSMTSVTKLPHPELRLSHKALTEYEDQELRFKVVLALKSNASSGRMERWMNMTWIFVVPIAAAIILKITWLVVLLAVVTIGSMLTVAWRQSTTERRKTLLAVVQYTKESDALYRFLEHPDPAPLWVPEFFTKRNEIALKRDIAYFKSKLEMSGLESRQ